MAQTLDQLVQEAKDFFRLKRKLKQTAAPEADTPAYLLSRKWLRRYKQFLFYNEIKNNMKPEPAEDHFQANHPGPITNQEDLLAHEPHLLTSGQNHFEDDWLPECKSERTDFKVVDEDIWAFLVEKYTGHPVKRFYKKTSSGSTVEVKLLKIPIVLGSPSDFKKMQEEEAPVCFVKKFVAASAHSGYSELKQRLTVCLQHYFSEPFSKNQLRLWKLEKEPDEAVFEEFKLRRKQKDEEEKGQVEVNSGVRFPGETLENFVGTPFKLADENFDNKIFVEIRESERAPFFFLFKKEA